jgi:hypothetical protein
MENINGISHIHIVHENLVALCRMISTTHLKKIDVFCTGETVFTDMTYTVVIRKSGNSHNVWLFEGERLIAASIKSDTVNLNVNIAMIKRKLYIVQTYLMLSRMGSEWVDQIMIASKGNDLGKKVWWAHNEVYEKTLAYWVSRGDKVVIEIVNDHHEFRRVSLVRSDKSPDGGYKNVREKRDDILSTYDHNQIFLNK